MLSTRSGPVAAQPSSPRLLSSLKPTAPQTLHGREEVEAGETQLFLEGGRPLRVVSVLNVLLHNGRGQTLYEEEQVWRVVRRPCLMQP